MKFPATCGRLPAIAGGYKQGCFKQNAGAGGFPQLAGDFQRTTEVTNRGVLNKRRSWEV